MSYGMPIKPKVVTAPKRSCGYDLYDEPQCVQLSAQNVRTWVAHVSVYLDYKAYVAARDLQRAPLFRRDFPLSDDVPFETVLTSLRVMFGDDVHIVCDFSFTDTF